MEWVSTNDVARFLRGPVCGTSKVSFVGRLIVLMEVSFIGVLGIRSMIQSVQCSYFPLCTGVFLPSNKRQIQDTAGERRIPLRLCEKISYNNVY